MTENKGVATTSTILWYVISALFITLTGVVGAWAVDKNQIDRDLEKRVGQIEQRYERIDTKLDLILEQYKLKFVEKR